MRTEDPDGLGMDVRAFAHAALHALAARKFGEDLDDYRATIDALAADLRERDWPEDTPRYLLRAYPRQLELEVRDLPPGHPRRAAVVATLTALAGSPARSARLLERIGHPGAVNEEIALLQGLLLRGGEDGDALLGRLLRLSLLRQPVGGSMAKVASEIAPVWVRTGRARAAYAFAGTVQPDWDRKSALREVGVAAAGQPDGLALAVEIAERLRGDQKALDVLVAVVAAEAGRDLGAWWPSRR
jgi:hypothetical protein